MFATKPGLNLERIGRVVLLIGLLLHALYVTSLCTHWLDPLFLEARGSFGQGADFYGIYQAGDNLLQGRSVYSDEGRPAGSPRAVPYFYFYRYLPPTAYVAALGAAVLRPHAAYVAWVATTELLLLAFLLLLARTRFPVRGTATVLMGIALGFSPFYLEQWMGQFSFVMALLLWVTLRSELDPRIEPGTFRARRDPGAGAGALGARNDPALGRDASSGVDRIPAAADPPMPAASGFKDVLPSHLRDWGLWTWSAAIALKSYPALFVLPYLRQGRWRRVAVAVCEVAVVCLPYYLLRPGDVRTFLRLNLGRLPPKVRAGSYGLASLVRGLAWHMPADLAEHRLTFGPLHVFVGNIPVVVITAAIILLSAAVTWRLRRTRAAAPLLAVWILTFFLIYKDVWEYHYVMLLPVVAALAARGDPRPALLLGTWLALPTPWGLYSARWNPGAVTTWPIGLTLVHYGSKVFPMIGLYVLAWRRSWAGGRNDAAETEEPEATTVPAAG